MDGSRYERRFVSMLCETPHWHAQRAAASGSATDADLPDVTFAHDGISFAGEMKATSEPYTYFQPKEIDALQRYAAAYGMRAVAIGRFQGDPSYYIWNPVTMHRTDAGTYRGSPGAIAQGRIKEPGTAPQARTPSAATADWLADCLGVDG